MVLKNRSKKKKKADALTDLTKWQKAKMRDVDWEKEDLNDVLYWGRQVFAIIIGITWGLIPMTGLGGHISYGVLSGLVFYLYYAKYLGVVEEDFGRWELFTEGAMPSYALFMVAWVATYTIQVSPIDDW
mmetsp:Transcript_17564/g.19763  ORF Transcript_17564/g.19763 Transcript_17564/m.19763 type:complete len:129 (-) Transcript_17564:91-477(-)|eukprot:CAMPEP_0205824826 /NCGR_PEP_ID=MMETSP0206-20130828/22881_1 /ASSEMBLY_ACC=CAM_ASM_000279 /TAXON_ID=36767 /ORGANISM="Euplotes focardii, Strain TN1" /LENGTH=128 /DNA_ID=CAMNT_0053123315 /DNA_START=22 /DNA_END=408 /DNA_ORIENTATION=+